MRKNEKKKINYSQIKAWAHRPHPNLFTWHISIEVYIKFYSEILLLIKFI